MNKPLPTLSLTPEDPGAADCLALMAELSTVLEEITGSSGIGSAVLTYLEREAAALGYQAVWLETRLVNRRAVDFYTARGYARIPNYGKYIGNPLAVCFEKQLPGA